MGLDMYLSRKKVIKQEEINKEMLFSRYHIIQEYCGYWRKFNALHNYIVNEFANGVDECQTVYLRSDKINQLVEVLREVDANPQLASELLPTSSGFFFGSTEYSEGYFNDVKNALEVFSKALEDTEDGWEFEYYASW